MRFSLKVIESKFTWHFLFLQFDPSCFKNSSDPDVTPKKPIYHFYWKYEILIPNRN